jgi:hypothetical protein
MSNTPLKQVYRIDVSEFTCRSVGELVRANVLEIADVEAVAAGRDGTLLVVTSSEQDRYDEIVRATVDAGLDPVSVKVSDAERIFDPMPLSLEEAGLLGLLEAPKEPVRATVETVQRISVAVTDGYDPDTILIEAGVPAEITFSEGHGCLGRVVFEALGIEADLEQGGATVRIPALEPGTYGFRCGRDMVHGTLIAE